MATSQTPEDQTTRAVDNVSPITTPPQVMQEKPRDTYYAPQPVQQQTANYFAQYPQSYGQPFQSYAPPHAPPPPLPANWRGPGAMQRPVETKQWRIALIALHSASLLIALLDICLSVSLLKWGLYNDDFEGDLASVALYVIVAPGLALIWSGADLMTRMFRNAHAGITPGAHVGCTLIIWLAAIVTGGLVAALAPWLTQTWDNRFGGRQCYNSSTGRYEFCDDDAGQEGQDIGTRRAIFVTIVVLKFLLWAVNFAIFVRACIDTHRRNVSSRPVVYIPYWAGPAGPSWQPLQQIEPQGQAIRQGDQSGRMQAQSPATAAQTPAADVTAPPPAHQVHEYYTPTSPRSAH